MKMVVEITNLTDAPDKEPRIIAIHGKRLAPGKSMRLEAAHIDKSDRALEKEGVISIGSLPSWYSAYKMKKGDTLSLEEIKNRLGAPKKNKRAIPPKIEKAIAPTIRKKKVKKKKAE